MVYTCIFIERERERERGREREIRLWASGFVKLSVPHLGNSHTGISKNAFRRGALTMSLQTRRIPGVSEVSEVSLNLTACCRHRHLSLGRVPGSGTLTKMHSAL